MLDQFLLEVEKLKVESKYCTNFLSILQSLKFAIDHDQKGHIGFYLQQAEEEILNYKKELNKIGYYND